MYGFISFPSLKLLEPLNLRSIVNYSLICLLLLGLLLLDSVTSFAAIRLKDVKYLGQDRIELLFDQNIEKRHILTEFNKNIIQFTLNETIIHPAKVLSVSGESVSKIFAYQYAPGVVRCRLSVQEPAESYKNNIILNTQKNKITLKFDQFQRLKKVDPVQISRTETDLALKRISSITSNQLATPPTQEPPSPEPISLPKSKAKRKSLLEMSGSITMAILFILSLIGFYFLGKLALKRIKPRHLMKIPSQLFAQYVASKDRKLISVIGSHYLGPRSKILVVRVANRIFVLAHTKDSLNPITELSGEEATAFGLGKLQESDFMGKDLLSSITRKIDKDSSNSLLTDGVSPFSKLLQQEEAKSLLGAAEPLDQQARYTSTRHKIKSRLEDLKPL